MSHAIVSIYVPVYNHEAYIVQALDRIRMQKTEYSFEVFVGEDCSTDNTRQVLQQWEAAHPDPRFHFLYREQNMRSLGQSNQLDLRQRCTGKYLICLEGDDFWTDPEKLQKQVSFLESHPDYYGVAHLCTVVGADSLPNGETYPQCSETEYTFSHFANDILPGQFATFLCRNYMQDPNFDLSLSPKKAGPGDRKIYFSTLCHGKIHCMQEPMSAYRHIVSQGTSFSANYHYQYETEEVAFRNRLEYAYRVGHPDAIRCMEYLYLRNLRHALRTRKISSRRALGDLKNIRHKVRAAFALLRRDLYSHILKKPFSV